jgi:rare lipoprotein A
MVFSACGGRKTNASLPPALSPRPAAAGTISDSDLEGLASYYAEPYHGRRTANGEVFDTYREMTAAHRTLPFNTVVRVTNKANSETVDVRINDRGPFIDGRVIDLSLAAAQKIDMVRAGIVPVQLRILKEGDGARVTAASGTPVMYAVQVGAFANEQSAADLKERLSRKFSAITIQAVAINETTLYRVRVGSEPDLLTAQKLASQLKKEDLNPFVVRVN